MSFQRVFGGNKAVIGMVHLLPLPGSPGYGGDFEAVYQAARRDLERLSRGGVSAAIVENFSDTPYTAETSVLTVSAMAILIDRLRKDAQIPLGVNVQFNCTEGEWDLAYLTGCAFMRVEAFVENRIGPHGISLASAPELMRRKAALPCDAMIFADINVKHTFPMAAQPVEFSISEAKEAGADAIIITGAQTGSVPSIDELRQARACAGEMPILVGSGISEATVADYLRIADGVIVGSAIKEDGKVSKPVDEERVRRLVAAAKKWQNG